MHSFISIISKFLLLFWLGLIGLTVSCSQRQFFSPIPQITFSFMQPSTVVALTQSFELEISYTDGDGDLGSDNAEIYNMFVEDTRTQLPDSVRILSYSLPNISSNARKPSIQGKIKVKLPPVLPSAYFPPYPNPEKEETFFRVYIVDRAGNKSNVITTPALTITP